MCVSEWLTADGTPLATGFHMTNSLNRFHRFQVHLEPEAFSVEAELMTPTFKLKRPQLKKHYQVCGSKCI